MISTSHMRNHWWWRPGWSKGTRFYTWHLTFQGAGDVHRYTDAYRCGLAHVEGLDLIPDQWLHLTMQGVGDVRQVAEKEVAAIVDAVSGRLRALSPFTLHFDAPVITPEAVETLVQPAERVRELRNAIRAGIADVWTDVPESEDGFIPHVSVAYSNSDGPAEPIQAALDAVHTAPAMCEVTHAELIIIGRDDRMYTWETVASSALGSP
jgi:2'-5' RNA ligase